MKKVLVLSLFLLMVPGCNWFSSETTQEKSAETQQDNAVATREKLQKLDTQIAAYKEKVGVLPGDLKELVEGPKDESLRKNWTEALAVEADLVDAWGQPFVYSVSTVEGAAPYELFSVGERASATEPAATEPTTTEAA
jgi:hypothetical protein